ncbi:hepatic lectin-like [Macrobrachium nipponense]|uniref:hepatic lectin-like n=1 Tax=Macrobrachium nipponense TaxID=159736 RepID=UPI0030C8A7E2
MKERTAVIAAFVLLFGAASAVICPLPFLPIGDHCYYFSSVNASWKEARGACQGMSAELSVDLAVFDLTCEDYDAVFDYLTTTNIKWWWLGGTDEYHEDYWTWVDGRPINMQKGYWQDEEPDKNVNQHFLHAVYLQEFYPRWRLGNLHEGYLAHYVCQYRLDV